jgi:hypothetical protein
MKKHILPKRILGKNFPGPQLRVTAPVKISNQNSRKLQLGQASFSVIPERAVYDARCQPHGCALSYLERSVYVSKTRVLMPAGMPGIIMHAAQKA